MALLTQANWNNFVQKDLSEVFMDQYRDWQSMLPSLFRNVDATQGTEYDQEVGDLGEVPEFHGQVAFDDSRQGYRKSISEQEYALGIKVQRKLLRNDLYGVVRDNAGLLAASARARREGIGASIFNNAFNTTHTVGDGLALCSTAHTSNYGGSAQGNSGTSALSAAALEATRILMVAFKTNRDNIMTSAPDTLLVPTNLHEKAWEIVNTYGKMDGALNNRNFHFGKYNLAVWDNFLTDSNNWFLLDSKRMKKVLKYRQWEPVSFFKSGEFDTLVQKYATYFSVAVSSHEWRFIYGHAVA